MGLFDLFSPKMSYEYKGQTKRTNAKHFVSSGDFVEDQKIGLTFEKSHDYDNAIAAYYHALDLAQSKYVYPHPPNIYKRLSIIYRKLGLLDEEIQTLKDGIKNTNAPQSKVGHRWLVDRLSKIEKGVK